MALTRRNLVQRGLALASAFLLSACDAGRAAPGARPSSYPRAGGTLRISRPADIVPAGAPYRLRGANVAFVPLVYETLVAYDRQLTARPALATNWNWSSDSRRLTLQLRPGVKFHNGRPFTSEVAKFNLERLRDPALGSNWRSHASAMRISAPDPATLVINFETPRRGSFDALAGTFMAEPEQLEEGNAGHDFVGTGPFRFLEWVPSDHVTVTRNPEYWQPGKPFLDQVELRIIPDVQSALTWLETGRVDWMSGVPAQDVRRLQADPNYQVMLTANGGEFYYVGLDMHAPELADRRVRQAFNYAIDRPRIVASGLFGLGRPAAIPWPRQSVGYDVRQDHSYTFDLGTARQLLEAAAWDPSTVVALSLSKALGATRSIAEIYQADLARIGVNVKVQMLDEVDFASRLVNGGFGGAWLTGMGFMNLSPATFLNGAVPVRTPNPSHFETPRYKDLIEQVNAATDEQRLRLLLNEFNEIMLDESCVMPVAEAVGRDSGPEVMHAWVRDATWDTFGIFDYEDVNLSR